LYLLLHMKYSNVFYWIFLFLTNLILLRIVKYCICFHAWNILTRFIRFLSSFRRRVKITKGKCQKKNIGSYGECENIGCRNAESIYDEWGWEQTRVFFFDLFIIWYFDFTRFLLSIFLPLIFLPFTLVG
jgi:hypothetical protein